MIRFTYAQIRDVNFNIILQRLLDSRLPYAQAKKIVDLAYVVRDAQSKAQDLWEMLHKKYLVPVNKNDPQGPSKIDQDLSPEDKELALRELADFLRTEVILDEDPIPMEILEQTSLTGNELVLVRDLFS